MSSPSGLDTVLYPTCTRLDTMFSVVIGSPLAHLFARSSHDQQACRPNIAQPDPPACWAAASAHTPGPSVTDTCMGYGCSDALHYKSPPHRLPAMSCQQHAVRCELRLPELFTWLMLWPPRAR